MSEQTAADQKSAWRSWLVDRADGDEGITGFDAAGWDDATWVLHFMYESPDGDSALTHDDLHLDAVNQGLIPATIVGSVNLDEVTTVVGNALGMSARPSGWNRLRWRALAERLSTNLDHQPFPPCFRWYPYQSWPATLRPPDEGSLDAECLEALLNQLAAHCSDGLSARCVAYYSPLANGGDFDDLFMEEVALGDVANLIDPDQGRIGTPSNLWPIDRSWMVFTDWDLWGTKVSGPRALIDSLRAAPDLECVEWHSPDEGRER